MKLAIFDIDGTLVNGNSERMFWRYLMRCGKQGPRQIFSYLLFLLRYLPTGGIYTAKKNKAYLAGLRTKQVEMLASIFVTERLMCSLYEPAVQRLKQHLNRGDMVILMSGTLDCLAYGLANHLGVKKICATLCSQHHGIFLAQPPAIHPFNNTKLSLTLQLAHELKIKLTDISAYGNSSHDLSLLAAVGTPVAVRPDANLLRVAQELEWEVIDSGAREGASQLIKISD